jgi:hypothetical protein
VGLGVGGNVDGNVGEVGDCSGDDVDDVDDVDDTDDVDDVDDGSFCGDGEVGTMWGNVLGGGDNSDNDGICCSSALISFDMT